MRKVKTTVAEAITIAGFRKDVELGGSMKSAHRARSSASCLCAILAGFSLSLSMSGLAAAATITVNTTDDEVNTDGDCSLREAFNAANNDSSTGADACTPGTIGDSITVPAGVYTLSTIGTELLSNDTVGDVDLTINGAGSATTIIEAHATVGMATARVLRASRGNLTLSGLTIRHGNGAVHGGGVRFESPSRSLTITDCEIVDNHTASGNGGGVSTSASVAVLSTVISGTTISRNTTIGSGGGLYLARIIHERTV